MCEADPRSDFHFVERDDPEKIAATLLKLVQERIPERFRLDPIRDVQVLCPMNRGSLGVREMNTALQKVVLRQHVRIAPHLLDCLLAIGLEDSHRSARAHAVAVQEQHDFPDLLCLLPCVRDSLPACGADPSTDWSSEARFSITARTSAPKRPTNFFARIGPMPLTNPLPRYRSIPSAVVAATVFMVLALNCSPCSLSLTHQPSAASHSPAVTEGSDPMTVVSSRCPRALTRRTQKPLSSLWKVTRSIRPETSSVAGLRSGIAAFMLGDSFSHGRSALGGPFGKAILLGFGCWRGSGRIGRLRGAGSLCDHPSGLVRNLTAEHCCPDRPFV